MNSRLNSGRRQFKALYAIQRLFLRRTRPAALSLMLACLLAGCYSLPQAKLLEGRRALTDTQSILGSSVDGPADAANSKSTPFQPLRSTPVAETGEQSASKSVSVTQIVNVTPAPDPRYQLKVPAENHTQDSANQAQSSSAYSPEPALDFYGIDFTSHQRVTILIYPPDENVGHGKPIKISFIPGNRCRFGDNRGCVYAYKPTSSGNVIVITVHSGVGGEAQRLRAALEGTGINRAAYSLKKVNANMDNLTGAQVVISQGDRDAAKLRLVAATRIPARSLARYFRASMAEISFGCR